MINRQRSRMSYGVLLFVVPFVLSNWACADVLEPTQQETSQILSGVELQLSLDGSAARIAPTEQEKDLAMQTQASFQLGVWVFPSVFLGAATRAAWLSEFEASDSYGNISGYRFTLVEPVLGVRFWNLVTFASAQFLGPYEFSYPTRLGTEMSWQTPLGFRLDVLYSLSSSLRLGLNGRWTQFKDLNLVRVRRLTKPVQVVDVGVSASYAFEFWGAKR